ncbi:endolytic transglycosylase MltG [Candidatus Peribacteria bacterium]|nr:endolytic transglycosylase MltG [Candidatus Peribacteria bacterium]
MKKLLFIIALLIGATYLWYTLSLRPADASSEQRVSVTVKAGSTTTHILEQLKENGLIRSSLATKIYMKLNGLDGSLQAGVFLLKESFDVPTVIRMLQLGKGEEIAITIPEGYTVKDIDAVLAEVGLSEPGAIIDCANTCDFSSFEFLPTDTSELAKRGGKLEGYLFPDTYYAPVEFVPKFFLERMLGNFRKQVLTPYESVIEADSHSLHEIITMASLVEKESRHDDERSTVAAILWKRLGEDWGLGVDAAVRYIVDKPTDEITAGDLNVNSPYNLRKFRGLTPGPIANPGKKSIEAVLYPKETRYWYYLHDKEGSIHYSETNDEHNTKRYMYLGGGSK